MRIRLLALLVPHSRSHCRCRLEGGRRGDRRFRVDADLRWTTGPGSPSSSTLHPAFQIHPHVTGDLAAYTDENGAFSAVRSAIRLPQRDAWRHRPALPLVRSALQH